ncbi:hypothetical protein F4677DRAFT_418915 [Hypoxylon crocopeplum]|nr:hypothetical protein F4677DRAFT_418915 [Hypoxylon crocopeplum]
MRQISPSKIRKHLQSYSIPHIIRCYHFLDMSQVESYPMRSLTAMAQNLSAEEQKEADKLLIRELREKVNQLCRKGNKSRDQEKLYRLRIARFIAGLNEHQPEPQPEPQTETETPGESSAQGATNELKTPKRCARCTDSMISHECSK